MSSETQKYKKGDRVKVNVGHWMYSNKENSSIGKFIGKSENGGFYYDIRPQLTEDTATVEYTYGEKSETDGRFSKGESGYKQYSLKFDKYGSISWFDEENITPSQN